MSVPDIVASALGDEQVAARVDLGGEDTLFVTPSRTLIYRGEGLLSDEAIEEYTHQAERVTVKTSRRKARITLTHSLEGEQSFTVPPSRLDDALHPVLAGVLNQAGVTEPGETVKRTFRFSELTVIVTSHRLVKHIGAAVWDTDYEEYRYQDATGLTFEDGSVATQVVLEVDGRRERIKAPNERAPELRAELEEAICDFYDVSSIPEFEAKVAPEPESDEDDEPTATANSDVGFESGLSPLETGGDTSEDASDAGDVVETDAQGTPAAATEPNPAQLAAEAADATGAAEPESDTEPVQDDDLGDTERVSNEALAERMDELTTAVKRQNELLATHADTIEQLIEELKRMR